MKQFIAFLGLVGILSAYTACSQDDGPAAIPANSAVDNPVPASSATVPVAETSATTTDPATTDPVTDPVAASSSSINPALASLISSSSKAKKEKTEKDPIIVHERVTIDTGATEFDDPYFSSGIFCWTSGCEVWASSASGPDVTDNGEINMGGDIPVAPNFEAEPVIEGLVMKDMRDTQSYPLMEIGGKLWTMNMNIAVTGSNCYGDDVKNCGQYGRLYTFSAAQSACPVGWALPTRADFEAAKDAENFWIFGGRGKDGNEDFIEKMGFYWLNSSEVKQDGDEDNCNGSSCGMIFVIDAPDYSDGISKFQNDSKSKGFSVRCVQQ